MEKKRNPKISETTFIIRMPKEIGRQLSELAEARRVSRAAIVRELIKKAAQAAK